MEVSRTCPICAQSATTAKCIKCGYDFTIDFYLSDTFFMCQSEDNNNLVEYTEEVRTLYIKEMEQKMEAISQKLQEEEERRRKLEEVEKRKKALEEELAKAEAEEDRKRKEAEETKRRAEAEEAKRRAEAEETKRRKEAEEAKRRAEAETARKNACSTTLTDTTFDTGIPEVCTIRASLSQLEHGFEKTLYFKNKAVDIKVGPGCVIDCPLAAITAINDDAKQLKWSNPKQIVLKVRNKFNIFSWVFIIYCIIVLLEDPITAFSEVGLGALICMSPFIIYISKRKKRISLYKKNAKVKYVHVIRRRT